MIVLLPLLAFWPASIVKMVCSPLQSRRTLLKTALVTLLPSPVLALSSATISAETTALYVSGALRAPEDYVAVVFDEHASVVASVPLGALAHGAASHRQIQRACLFARRPGMFMNTFDRRTPGVHAITEPVSGRHFYGHGAYSRDGKLLARHVLPA